MVEMNNAVVVVMLACLSLAQGVAHGGTPETSGKETEEYRRAAASIGVTAKTLALGGTDGFTKYEKFADEIQQGWSQRNKEYHARLMLAICGPLTSGWFKKWSAI